MKLCECGKEVRGNQRFIHGHKILFIWEDELQHPDKVVEKIKNFSEDN